MPFGVVLTAYLLGISIILISPELTVVSVGYKNKFRHPSEAVMGRIKQHTDRIHRTDHSGALWLRSNGKEI